MVGSNLTRTPLKEEIWANSKEDHAKTNREGVPFTSREEDSKETKPDNTLILDIYPPGL